MENVSEAVGLFTMGSMVSELRAARYKCQNNMGWADMKCLSRHDFSQRTQKHVSGCWKRKIGGAEVKEKRHRVRLHYFRDSSMHRSKNRISLYSGVFSLLKCELNHPLCPEKL